MIQYSRNIYGLPFKGKFKIAPAPFHYEKKWQRYAVDFTLDLGTPIVSAQEGIVSRVIDGFNDGGHLERFLNKSNLVIIEHDYGERSAYVHLQKGIKVNEGDTVKKGELLGYSGLSGYTSHPHLHYQTMANDSISHRGWMSIPTRFDFGNKKIILTSPKE